MSRGRRPVCLSLRTFAVMTRMTARRPTSGEEGSYSTARREDQGDVKCACTQTFVLRCGAADRWHCLRYAPAELPSLPPAASDATHRTRAAPTFSVKRGPASLEMLGRACAPRRTDASHSRPSDGFVHG